MTALRLALAVQGALLIAAGSPAARAFCATRLDPERRGHSFGTLPADIDGAALIARALPD